MFKSYSVILEQWRLDSSNEDIYNSLYNSEWLFLLVQRYPIAGLEAQRQRYTKNRYLQWRALHSVHNPSLHTSRAQSYQFLEQWAKQQNDLSLWPAISNDLLICSVRSHYNEIIGEIGTLYLNWGELNNNVDGNQEDRRLFIADYCASFHATPHYATSILWSYYWIKQQARCSTDPLWHDFYEALEEMRCSNNDAPIIINHPIWGSRTWSCGQGIAQRCQDFVTYHKTISQSKQELIRWYEELLSNRPQSSARGQNIASFLESTPQLRALWSKAPVSSSITTLLCFIDKEAYAADNFWSPLLIEAGLSALSPQNHHLPYLAQIRLWEEELLSRAQSAKLSMIAPVKTMMELMSDYAEQAFEAFVSSQGLPTKLLQSLYTHSLIDYFEEQGVSIHWSPKKCSQYHIKNPHSFHLKKQAIIETRTKYLLRFGVIDGVLYRQNLRQDLEQLPAALFQEYLLEGQQLGLLTQNISVENPQKNICILKILSCFNPFFDPETDSVNTTALKERLTARYSQNLESFLSRQHPIDAPSSFPIGTTAQDYHVTKTTSRDNSGLWIAQLPPRLPKEYQQSLQEIPDWETLTPYFSQNSGFEKEFFDDLDAIAQAQSWPLLEQLLDYWDMGIKPAYDKAHLQSLCLAAKKNLSAIAQEFYRSHPDPQGLTYVLSPSLIQSLYQQWIKDISKQQTIFRWPQSLYHSLIQSNGGGLFTSIDLPLLLDFSLKNWSLSLATMMVGHWGQCATIVDDRLVMQLIAFGGEMSSLLIELSRAQWVSTEMRKKVFLELLLRKTLSVGLFIEGTGDNTTPEPLLWLLSAYNRKYESILPDIFKELARYDVIEHRKKNDIAPYSHRCSAATVLQHFNLSLLEDRLDRVTIVSLYKQLILALGSLSKDDATTWFHQLQTETSQGWLCLEWYDLILVHCVASNKALFHKQAFDGCIPLMYYRYDMLSIMSSYCLIDIWDIANNRQTFFFKRFLEMGPPPFVIIKQEDIIFLNKIAQITAEGALPQEVYEGLLPVMLHESYQNMLPQWLGLFNFQVESLIPFIAPDDSCVQTHIKSAIKKSCLSLLPGIKTEYYCPGLSAHLKLYLDNPLSAQLFYERLKRWRWAALFNASGLSPIEQLLSEPSHPRHERHIKHWLEAGHPVIIGPRRCLILQARDKGYHTLAPEMERYKNQLLHHDYQRYPQPLEAYYFGDYQFQSAPVLFSASEQSGQSGNTPKYG